MPKNIEQVDVRTWKSCFVVFVTRKKEVSFDGSTANFFSNDG